MEPAVIQKIIQKLTNGTPVDSRKDIEARYPARNLSEGAEVTRFCPSPSGFMHIGGIYAALICQTIARQSNGVYMLRVEDTDKKREVVGATQLISEQLLAFDLSPDEGLQVDGSQTGSYGPYLQSMRQEIYLTFAIELLQSGRAYPCFATTDELQNATADQQAKKLRPGYYGEWALWRDKTDDEIEQALSEGLPFVLRFKSLGSHSNRVTLNDVLKGQLELPENDLDIPLIKSDEHRLPTYHLAHVVDDYLMRSTIIIRGEEWLPSTPLHIELCSALNITPFRYAHTGLISIIGGTGGKRKLSKRKDPEADVTYWRKEAYPIKAVKAYLLGLANSNFEDWWRENPDSPLEEFPFSIEKLSASRSPLLDMKKVEDYAKEVISRLPQTEFNKQALAWAELHNKALYDEMIADADYTTRVLSIERHGDSPRKDVAKWSDVSEQFNFYYDKLFELSKNEEVENQLQSVPLEVQKSACEFFISNYQHQASKEAWFENMKRSADQAGYALDKKSLKEHPNNYKGGLADFAKIIRVRLTGKNRTPDLYEIMQIMGEDRVRNRLEDSSN